MIGSTGSVGRNVLSVLEHFSDRFRVYGLAARSAVERLAGQVAAFRPQVVAIVEGERAEEFRAHCARLGVPPPEVLTGERWCP